MRNFQRRPEWALRPVTPQWTRGGGKARLQQQELSIFVSCSLLAYWHILSKVIISMFMDGALFKMALNCWVSHHTCSPKFSGGVNNATKIIAIVLQNSGPFYLRRHSVRWTTLYCWNHPVGEGGHTPFWNHSAIWITLYLSHPVGFNIAIPCRRSLNKVRSCYLKNEWK